MGASRVWARVWVEPRSGAFPREGNPFLDPTLLSFGVIDNGDSPPTAINTGVNLYQADGDGLFDIQFLFPPPISNPPKSPQVALRRW